MSVNVEQGEINKGAQSDGNIYDLAGGKSEKIYDDVDDASYNAVGSYNEVAVDVPVKKETVVVTSSKPTVAREYEPTGADHLTRWLGIIMLLNIILAFIIFVIMCVWVDDTVNDVYTDRRHSFAIFAFLYAFVMNIVNMLIRGWVAKDYIKIHYFLIVHCVVIAVLLLAGSSCIAESADHIDSLHTCDVNDCDNLIAVAVLGFITLVGMILQIFCHWRDVVDLK